MVVKRTGRTTIGAPVLAGFALAGALVLGSGAVAFAQEPPTTTAAPPTTAATPTEPTTMKPTEAGKCVEMMAKAGKPAEDCLKAPNPILPKGNELVWGTISFVILFTVMAKKGYPAVKKSMDARATKIKDSLDEADSTRKEAQTILEEYRAQLADAKSEGARIIEEARQTADKLRQDLKKQAESEVAEIKTRAQEDIATQVERATADLQARVAELSIDLAEKVVEQSLDRETNMALIERFIAEMEGAAR